MYLREEAEEWSDRENKRLRESERQTDRLRKEGRGRGDENTIQFCLKLRKWHASQIAKAGVHRGG